MSNIDPAFILVELAMLGVDVEVVRGELRLRRGRAIPPDLARRLRDAKPQIIAHLAEQGGVRNPLEGARSRWPSRNAACLSCGGSLFVRLRNGRRSVCLICERPKHDDIVSADGGVVCDGQRNGGAA